MGMEVDPHGNVWFVWGDRHSTCMLPVGPLDARGNPTYDWAGYKVIAPQDTSPLHFQPTMVQPVATVRIMPSAGVPPGPRRRTTASGWAARRFVRFDAKGQELWAVRVPQIVCGMDIIPGTTGCMVGGSIGSNIYRYTEDGLCIGKMEPGEAMGKLSGWFDNHASVAVNRDPRDHLLDVFAEDVFITRIAWYRVDDHDIQTISGDLKLSR